MKRKRKPAVGDLCCDSEHEPKPKRGMGYMEVVFVAPCPDCGLDHQGEHALPHPDLVAKALAPVIARMVLEELAREEAP